MYDGTRRFSNRLVSCGRWDVVSGISRNRAGLSARTSLSPSLIGSRRGSYSHSEWILLFLQIGLRFPTPTSVVGNQYTPRTAPFGSQRHELTPNRLNRGVPCWSVNKRLLYVSNSCTLQFPFDTPLELSKRRFTDRDSLSATCQNVRTAPCGSHRTADSERARRASITRDSPSCARACPLLPLQP